VPRDSGVNCTEIANDGDGDGDGPFTESGETLLGDDGEFYPICSSCPANVDVVNAVTLLAYPDVTCPAGYRDVPDANECERLAKQNGASRFLTTVIALAMHTLLTIMHPHPGRIRMDWAALRRHQLDSRWLSPLLDSI